MKRILEIAVAAAMVVLAPAAATAASKTIAVEPFTEIEISSGIEATVSIGDEQSVIAESPDVGYLDELIVEVLGGRFHAYFDWNVLDLLPFGSDRRVSLAITVPRIDVIDANSGASVKAAGIEAERLRLGASSGANLTVSDVTVADIDAEASSGAALDVAGTCDAADVESSSGARVEAGDLVCRAVKVEASSGARADVHATAAVDAEASSGASVDVRGNPADARSDESSGGDVVVH
jgi:hypothetical protein